MAPKFIKPSEVASLLLLRFGAIKDYPLIMFNCIEFQIGSQPVAGKVGRPDYTKSCSGFIVAQHIALGVQKFFAVKLYL